MILVHGRAADTCEVFFDEHVENVDADVIRYVQRSAPVRGARCTPFHTLLIDLTADPGSLLAGFSQTTRYEIDRAGSRDALIYRWWYPAEEEVIDELRKFYDAASPLGRMDRQRVLAYRASGGLDLSRIERDGKVLVWHAHLRAATRVRLLYSASMFRAATDRDARALASRANRLQHWRDMIRFRSEAIRTYDFGGWYAGGGDQQRLAINRFKGSFGGTVVREFNCVRPLTIRGRLAVAIEELLHLGPVWDRKLRPAP